MINKKRILWVLPVLVILAAAVYLSATRSTEKATPESTPPARESFREEYSGRGDGTGRGGGKRMGRRHGGGQQSGELKLEIVRDGTLAKTIVPGDLESIPKDPRPVLSNRVRSGWEMKKLVPEALGSGVTRVNLHSSWGETREISREELQDPQMIFFFSQSKRGGLNFFPIDLRQTRMIPAGRKASRIKKIMLKDVRKIEIFSGGTK